MQIRFAPVLTPLACVLPFFFLLANVVLVTLAHAGTLGGALGLSRDASEDGGSSYRRWQMVERQTCFFARQLSSVPEDDSD